MCDEAERLHAQNVKAFIMSGWGQAMFERDEARAEVKRLATLVKHHADQGVRAHMQVVAARELCDQWERGSLDALSRADIADQLREIVGRNA